MSLTRSLGLSVEAMPLESGVSADGDDTAKASDWQAAIDCKLPMAKSTPHGGTAGAKDVRPAGMRVAEQGLHVDFDAYVAVDRRDFPG
jgi:hypothetical protein